MVLGICLVIFEGAGLCLKERGRCFSLSGAKYLPLTFICLILGADKIREYIHFIETSSMGFRDMV